jgi:hydroxyacid-oxoacid transhydrogenase
VNETIFTVEATPVKYGSGAVDDTGWEATRLGMTRALVVTDPGVVAAGHLDRVVDSLRGSGIDPVVFDRSRVEPTLESLEEAAAFAREARVDGFVSVGGGSAMDTGKVACLLDSFPGPVLDFVNPPVGGGRKPDRPLKPHLAIPTTPGTGSEATTVAVLDIPSLKVKSGISHRYLRPAQAIVDPELTRTLASEVVASAGLDVVCHAAESFLSKPYTSRPRPASPDDRPPYQGSNPVADLWSARALETGGTYLRRAVADADDVEARGAMMLAATLAGIGFGSAGVHIPHACAYPIAGLKHEYVPAGYPEDHGFVPHGLSVIVTSPAAFRFTYEADPDKHERAAALLTGEPQSGPDALPDVLRAIMADVGAPDRVSAFGYSEDDIPELVDGAMKQARLLTIAPRDVEPRDIESIFRASL